MTLNDLGISFEINNGKLLTKPFNFKIKDVGFTIGGITGLDKTINYLGTVTLPDKLNFGRFSTYNITIGGTFSKPEVKLDLKGKVTELATETAAKVETEINKKVDEVKEKAIEEARKQKEKAMLEAQKKADKLIAAADSVGNLLILQAEKQGQELVKKANNPITKAAAEIASKKLVDEARKKAAEGKSKAQTEAQKIIQKAAESVEI
jgi:vacuolar-type H+-ATPase subunit H